MQVPPLVILQFAPGEASNSVKKADGGDWAATSERAREGASAARQGHERKRTLRVALIVELRFQVRQFLSGHTRAA